MTSIEATETIDAPPKLQIWNNAAFDDGDSQITSAIEEATSWSSQLNESFDSDGIKENHFSISVSSSLQSSVSITTDQEEEAAAAAAPSAKSKTVKSKSGADRSKRDIDAEIEKVEKEIGRLSTRLESLRLEKAEQTARSVAIRGRIVPAKFMESQKPTVKFDDSSLQGSSKSRATTTNRRGVSLGPAEIFNSAKRSETVTPLQTAQNRRKSCFFKLPGIDEGKMTNRGNNKGRTSLSLSLSPRSRKAKMTTAGQKQAATTVGSKRTVKKEEGVLLSIQPKKLFKDDEKNVSLRKPLKPGRVVASRYSLVSKTQGGEKDARKRSLPENEEKENHNRSEKRRASDENSKSEGRVKKRWEIPSEVDLYSSGVNDDETPICEKLPKIRTLRRLGGSPRDSGAAKRVAELQSKDRNFTFCQLLRFEE
ncbi:PREDICTED: uncharacterized protein LOC109127072 [Camelina sativa]|uniref:Uncharacterized protein LOC109127072 n=1 Tax=Camelina sativa TaxID=90675 RepID=A0ABM1QJK3_CAMSA|nr:PREDICTED: uncharacterized protein LOC109127072 [Camelina sativa]